MAVNDRYVTAIETSQARAVVHIIDTGSSYPRVVASTSSSSRATLGELVRLANKAAELEALERSMARGHPSTDGWPTMLPRSKDWAARDAEDGGS